MAEPAQPRVHVAVAPRLLADVLGEVLALHGLEVVVADDASVGVARPGGGFDVVVATGEVVDDAGAIVVRLPDSDAGAGVAEVRAGDVRRDVAVGGVSDVADLVIALVGCPGD